MGVGGRRRQEDRLGRPQVPVEQRHGQLGVQVAAVAQPLDDGARATLAAVVGQEPGDEVHLDAGKVGGGGPDQGQALLDIEQVTPGLGGVVGNPDDDDVDGRVAVRDARRVGLFQGRYGPSGEPPRLPTFALCSSASLPDPTVRRRPGALHRRCYIFSCAHTRDPE